MNTLCPTCQSPIDPARAPAARVRGTRVVTYCSDRCAERALEVEPEAPAAIEPPSTTTRAAAVAKPVPVAPTRTATAEPVRVAPPVEPLEVARAETGDVVVAVDREEPSTPVTQQSAPRRSPLSLHSAPHAPGPGERRSPLALHLAPHAPGPGERRSPLALHLAPHAPGPGERRSPLALHKWQLVAGCSIALIVGMGMVAIEACPSSTPVRAAYEEEVAPSRLAAASSPGATDPAPAAAAETAPRALDREKLLANATSTLRALLDSPSERLQRLAAMALARIADPAAVEHLRSLLGSSSSDLVKLQIAYALARAGDATGLDLLTTSLKARARDTRLDAARFLAQLGDEHAAKVLRNLLGYRAFRISAAGLLARLGDEKGVEALREVLDAKRSSVELRMRAAVELGRAGDASVHDRLVEILEGGQYQVGAALALAALDDHGAVPALGHLLGLDSFRVRAALGLRRMGEKVDLEPLAIALANGNEVTQVTAAEAILILAGPATAAEHD